MTDKTSPEMWFGLVCEGSSDERTITRLVERVLTDEVGWLVGLFGQVIGWRGVLDHQSYTSWAGESGVKGLGRSRNIRVHGDFSGEDWRGEAIQAKKAIRLFREARIKGRIQGELSAVFLIRDTDGDMQRRDGMEAARQDSSASFEMVLGLPHTNRECWILVAFEPSNEDEQDVLDDLRSNLGFDPTEQAHRLTAQTGAAKKNAKRVLEKLLLGNQRREDDLIESAVVEDLKRAGENVGLADFIEEIKMRVAPRLRESGQHKN
jgi:hypothetical protein